MNPSLLGSEMCIIDRHFTADGQVWVVDSSKKLKVFESENGVSLIELPLPNQDVSFFGLTPNL